jgi:predicted nucleotidyltransferase
LAQIPVKVKNTIHNYLTALKEHNIPIKQAILFGSYAKGNYSDWSDIDIALVSDIFEGSRIKDRRKIRKITLSVSSDIEVLPYRPKDFTKEDPFVKEIIDSVIKII